METVKKFINCSTTSSLVERRILFEELFEALNNPENEIPELAFKVLSKLLQYMFPVYLDKKSKLQLIKFNDLLIRINLDQSLKYLSSSLEIHANSYILTKPYYSLSVLSLNAIDLINEIFISIKKYNRSDLLNATNQEFITLTKSYAKFSASIFYSDKKKRLSFWSGYKRMKYLFEQVNDLQLQFETVLKNTFIKDESDSKDMFLLSGFLMRYFTETKYSEIASFKSSVIDIYIKNIIGTRTKPIASKLFASNCWIKYVDRSEFKEKFMPALARALLRSPENVIETIGYILSEVNIDLNDFAKDLIALMSKQLIVKSEETQMEAVESIKCLVLQCSSVEIVQYIMKYLFSVLNGSEGKLTLPIQKNMVLSAISNCSLNPSFNSQDCVESFLDQFADFVKVELNDLTLHFAFEKFCFCLHNTSISSFQPNFMPNITSFFKKLLQNKTFSTTFKTDIYQAMVSVYSKSGAKKEIQHFESICLQSIERAQSQITHNQIFSVEALLASLLLTIYFESDSSYESKAERFISSINDPKKQLFTNEKFYKNLCEQSTKCFCDLFEKLTIINYSKETFKISDYDTILIHLLLHPNYSTRKYAQNVLRKICNWQIMSVNKSSFIFTILEKTETTFSSLNLLNESNYAILTHNGSVSSETVNWPSVKGINELLISISCLKSLTENDLKSLALKILNIANIPMMFSFDDKLYEKFLKKLVANNGQLKLQIFDLTCKQTDQLISHTISQNNLTKSQLNSIKILVKLDASAYLKNTINISIQSLLDSPDLKNVSKENFDIMNLPEGDLYDKTLIESTKKAIQDASLTNANQKKESKTYTYKEQLAEAELRKELERKKLKDIENKSYTLEEIRSKMSKKQQEMLELQIAKEKNIREEMLVKNSLINKASSVLIHAIEGNPLKAHTYLSFIIGHLTSFIGSPLCIGYVTKVFEAIAKTFVDRKKNTCSILYSTSFLSSLIYCTMRLSATPFNMHSRWTQEPLKIAFKRLCSMIRENVEKEIENDNFEISIFSLFYPFLKYSTNHRNTSESCYKDIIETLVLIANKRNQQQEEVIEFFRFNTNNGMIDYDQETMKSQEFELIGLATNFLSSEFFKLCIDLLEISVDRKISINIQYQASEAAKALFKFSIQLIYKVPDYTEMIYDNLEMYSYNYLLEVKEIIKALNSQCFSVRETVLTCLESLNKSREKCLNKIDSSERFLLSDKLHMELNHMLWISIFDVEKSNRVLAGNIWDNADQFIIDQKLCYLLVNDVIHPIEPIRLAAGEALSDAIKQNNKSVIPSILKIFFLKYAELAIVKEPKCDQFGRVINEEILDNWEARCGIAAALQYLAADIPNDDVIVLELFQFFVYKSLNDMNITCKNKMLDAAITALNFHGRAHINILLPLFENFLLDAPKSADYDSVRQNVVILMGTLAKHLEKGDDKVGPIIDKLISALGTPSQQVQEAVSKCLPSLVPSIKSQVPNYVDDLFNVLMTASSYGERRGAAYGLAGILKGVGMLSLRQLNVLQRLNDAVSNKSNAVQREGALLAYEMLTTMFSKVFEPYSVEILPNLLICFGDSDPNVRQAADDCAKATMSNLTFTGVKMILPKLLERLGEEESWRTKCGSVELLGAMAHCAPKQLSTCLPNIVPKLIEVLSDSHIKVQKAGTQALRQIGSVIKNPEILAITNVLLEALQDPAVKTSKALSVLLDTKFIHFIDAPSLALIMPVVQRAFQDRSTEIRKMAAQIMGNMYSLTDQKDLLPYLPAILPGLKLSLLDPVPDVRSVSSKALGAMIRAIGENGLNDIIAWLMEKLVSDSSGVDRSGAAQGLSEVFGALGSSKLEKSMPEIIERAMQVDLSPYVRDGYIMMFIYLPLTFGKEFTPYIGQIIQPIIKALADDCEFVRDTAIKAGQRIVNTYAETCISLLLPELEKGLFDLNWRIRYASVQLLGDLLYKISGVVGKMTTESAHEDDNFGTEKGSICILKALGEERRNVIYSGLYMGRCDVSLLVRQSALHIWKIIVSNTPRTLKEILNTLFNILLSSLANPDYDKRHIAAATLVDIVRKLGERVLPDIIPILEYGLNSKKADQREGVCIGLSEILSNTSRDSVMQFSDSLIPTVRKALLDPLSDVRKNAAKTFDTLHNMIGIKAMDEVALHLFDIMNIKSENVGLDGPPEWALDALKQIMLVKSRSLLPYLVPYLTEPPININAVCVLSTAASTEVLSKVLTRILITLVNALADLQKITDVAEEDESWVKDCEYLLLSIDDDDGIKTIVNELIQLATDDGSLKVRVAALDMLNLFCLRTEADYTDYVEDLVRDLFNLLNEQEEELLVKTWECLKSIINNLSGNLLLDRLSTLRQSIRVIAQKTHMSSGQFTIKNLAYTNVNYEQALLPGFCLPKRGISCLLPIFKEGLLNGSPEIKEQSAQTLSECIKLSDGLSLKSSVMGITGPLIRVLGERYNWTVKSSVLDAIYNLLEKVGVILKPFLPQLHPTFMKNLNDINKTVRLKSGYALAKLISMNPKFDQVINEIHNFIKATDEMDVKETLLNTMRLCLSNVGIKCQEETKKQILETLKSDLYAYSVESSLRSTSCGALGVLAAFLCEDDLNNFLDDILDYKKYSSDDWKYLHANCMIISTLLQHNAAKALKNTYQIKCFKFINECLCSDRVQLVKSSIRAVGFYIDYMINNHAKIDESLVSCFAKSINNNSAEVKELSVNTLSVLCIKNTEYRFDISILKNLIQMTMNGTRDSDLNVRLRSEIALVNLLHLKTNNDFFKECLESMKIINGTLEDCVISLSKDSFVKEVGMDKCVLDETLIRMES